MEDPAVEEIILNEEIKFKPIDLFELKFQNLNVIADVQEQIETKPGKKETTTVKKTILNKNSGIFSPNTFTAIVGPSGCGKTTLLNLLSGRLLSTNLALSGKLIVNGQQTNDINIFGQKIGYVMQQDLMFPTFTPRETFTFIANMRLPHASEEQKKAKVQEIIVALGLSRCADTYVGNEIIRGISGGEKKRTSIGIELLINPSIIFLDEPTTGLDSTTALNVIRFLNKLARSGRTVVSTIHQPSSEIFAEFDRLLIMVQGNIIYQGSSQESISYFKKIGYGVPSRSNPTDHYMKIMNKEGIAMNYIEKSMAFTDEQVISEFQERVEYFKTKYEQQNLQFKPTVQQALTQGQGQGLLSWGGQFYYIFDRALKNQLRNPLDVQLKLVQQVFQALFCIILYYKQAEGVGVEKFFRTLQNVQGCLFFILTTSAFGGVFANLATFSSERPIFVRQRMNNSYTTSSYFWARTSATIPFELLMPLVFIVICYFAVHLNQDVGIFFWAVLINQLVYWMAASYGLFLSTLIPSLNVAMSLVPVLIIPLMLVGGFFTNLNDVPKVFIPLEYISMFKYGFQAFIQNEYRSPISNGQGQSVDILTTKFNFPEQFWLNLVLLFVIGFLMRALAFVGMYLISNPKRVKLEKSELQEDNTRNVIEVH